MIQKTLVRQQSQTGENQSGSSNRQSVIPNLVVLVVIVIAIVAAPLPRFLELVTPLLRLRAMLAVPANGFIQVALGLFHPAMALLIVPVQRPDGHGTGEQKDSGHEHRQYSKFSFH